MAWTKIHDELFKKVNREFDAYQGYMQALCGSQVYAHAEEIAAMNFCYNQLLSSFHDYQAKDLKPLLEREKPLEFLAERWMAEQNVDLSGEFDHVFYSMGYQEESSEPETGPTMCQEVYR